jgi:peptidoglycan/LPS O-acetylase OafA/YrhL
MRYLTLDILRGVAALWVFMYHFPFYTPESLPGCLRAITQLGLLGVPMFFVISGYCLMASARTVQRRGEPVSSFLYRRLLRIYLPFWFPVLVVVAAPYLVELISSLKTGVYQPPRVPFANLTVVEWARVLTLTQVFFGTEPLLQHSFSAVNVVYWTLAIEVQFYLVMAVALACGKRFAWVLWAVTLLGCGFALFPETLRLGIFLPYWPMFALGLGLYWFMERLGTPESVLKRWAVPVAGTLAAAAVVAAVVAMQYGVFPADFLVFASLFTVFLWVAHPLDAPLTRRLKSPRALVSGSVGLLFALGAMSYSLYLVHLSLCGLGAQFARQVVRLESPAFPVLAIGVTLGMCWLFHLGCERPFIKRRVAEAPAPPAEPAAPLAPARLEPGQVA